MTVRGRGKIWICDSYLDSSIVKRLSLLPDNKGYTPELQRLGEIRRKYQQGEKLDEDESPRVAYGKYRDTRFRKLPDFFCVDGFFIVSQTFAAVLADFDTGDTELSPIRLYQGNRTGEIVGPWYFLNVDCRKCVFLPEQSNGGFRPYNSKTIDRWSVEGVKDKEIAVSAAALEGSHLWTDPSLGCALFISGPLEAALKETGATRTLRRRSCRILEGAGMNAPV